jgi:Uma2 family endonuclease
MSEEAKKLATKEDLLSLPDEKRPELINGEIVYESQPLPKHGRSQKRLGSTLEKYDSPRGGGEKPGGWWIITEAGIDYGFRNCCRHDLAGWRRDRLPELPDEEYVVVRPDWVCEVLSPSNRKRDLVEKKIILHQAKVPHYWIMDPEDQTVTVMRWNQEGYLSVADAVVGQKVRLEPFSEIEIDVASLFGVESASHT